METQAPTSSTPRDFFLWLGAVISLYASVTALLVLLFSYINTAYPDPLSYTDPYNGGVRFGMAVLIVMVPLMVVLFRVIRTSITTDQSRAGIRVRRWAIALTLFLAAATLVIDLVTVLNGFLSGELTTPFLLKALAVLLVAGAVFLHFLADSKGYWVAHPRKATAVGVGAVVLALLTIAGGFAITGTPSEMRAMRLDQQRADDLYQIQSQVVEHWRMRGVLPKDLGALVDPLSGYVLPVDPETGASYEYSTSGDRSFTLCATFESSSQENAVRAYGEPSFGGFVHEAGRTCFDRTIDPAVYPPYPKTR